MRKMPMLPCDQVIDRLWELLDGELSPDMDAAMRKHLERCNDCYLQYDFQRAYAEMLRNVARRMDPPGLRRRVLVRLLEDQVASEY